MLDDPRGRIQGPQNEAAEPGPRRPSPTILATELAVDVVQLSQEVESQREIANSLTQIVGRLRAEQDQLRERCYRAELAIVDTHERLAESDFDLSIPVFENLAAYTNEIAPEYRERLREDAARERLDRMVGDVSSER